MKADRSFVLGWAAVYEEQMDATEPWLFEHVGPAAVRRGHYEPDEFVAVARWKTPRSRPLVARNPDREVRDITAMAFAAS